MSQDHSPWRNMPPAEWDRLAANLRVVSVVTGPGPSVEGYIKADVDAALAAVHPGYDRDALEEAATELCDAVSAYFDPENQYTESRQNAVLRAKKRMRDALGG